MLLGNVACVFSQGREFVEGGKTLERREFIRLTGFGMGAIMVPVLGNPIVGAVTPIPTADKKRLADIALNAARGKGDVSRVPWTLA